jgi:2-dehydropantoate 2-reductase
MQTMTSSTSASQLAPKPTVLVVGTGAVGGFYGAKLAQAGARVSVLCRSDYEEVSSRGIAVTSIWGDFHFSPEIVVRSAAEYPGKPDFILVALKVLPEIDLIGMIRAAVYPGTTICLLQNGVEIEGQVAQAFPANEIVSGLAFICVSRNGPGVIHHQDYGRAVIGRFPDGDSLKARRLGDLLNAVGVPCQITADVVTARWQKLVWNAPFNPISVLGGGVDTATILGCPESAHLVRKVMEEVCHLAKAAGHELPPTVIEKNLTDTLTMKPYKTSMLLDYEARRPMEVEAILGNAVRVAHREGIAVPHLESLYALLQLVDRKSTGAASLSPRVGS